MFVKLVQLATFFAVVYSAINDGWGADVSGLAVGVVAALAAFVVTAIPLAIIDLSRRFRMNRNAKRAALRIGGK